MEQTPIEPSTRDKLVLSAEFSFLKQGYSATSVDSICRGAGATKGAFFHYFRSKKEIGLEALTEHAHKRFAFMWKGAADTDDAVNRFLGYITHLSNMVVVGEHPSCLLAAATAELAEVDEEFGQRVGSLFEQWLKQVGELTSAAYAQVGRDAAGAELCAAQCVATFQGSLMLLRATGNKDRSQQVLRAYRDQVGAQLRS